MIFYKDTQDLIDKVNFYKKNESKRIQLGLNGKSKYFKIFNNINFTIFYKKFKIYYLRFSLYCS